jgi:protein-S-isoprenylcysteine O-methyltransferase Ste14
MAVMPPRVTAHLIAEVNRLLTGTALDLMPTADVAAPALLVVVVVAYLIVLLGKRQSPPLVLWRWLSYRGTGVIREVSRRRGVLNWGLHLLIVYAFASTLLDFLRIDLRAAGDMWKLSPSLHARFQIAKYVVWSLTIGAVLVGYAYSVVSILWGKYIRSLDFTIVGWLTNAFCYPLLGVVIWRLVPSFTGIDPIITAGPAQLLMLWLGLILNVLYMLSICNLGLMFDLMADKGVRKSWFYAATRHPSYTLEALMFFAIELVGLTTPAQWSSIAVVFFLYWIRSEREDNFMQYSNPEYADYQRSVPYKFVPGFY